MMRRYMERQRGDQPCREERRGETYPSQRAAARYSRPAACLVESRLRLPDMIVLHERSDVNLAPTFNKEKRLFNIIYLYVYFVSTCFCTVFRFARASKDIKECKGDRKVSTRLNKRLSTIDPSRTTIIRSKFRLEFGIIQTSSIILIA